ncbi:CHY zinc finger protein [Virgibacillus ainsalahensis]
MEIHDKQIKGAIDKETRCRHYHQSNDRIAIKFYCCGEYFPCYQCHHEYGCGGGQVWPRKRFDQKAILCGSCGTEHTIKQYLESGNVCPECEASFNPGCSLHYHLYFERI